MFASARIDRWAVFRCVEMEVYKSFESTTIMRWKCRFSRVEKSEAKMFPSSMPSTEVRTSAAPIDITGWWDLWDDKEIGWITESLHNYQMIKYAMYTSCPWSEGLAESARTTTDTVPSEVVGRLNIERVPSYLIFRGADDWAETCLTCTFGSLCWQRLAKSAQKS